MWVYDANRLCRTRRTNIIISMSAFNYVHVRHNNNDTRTYTIIYFIYYILCTRVSRRRADVFGAIVLSDHQHNVIIFHVTYTHTYMIHVYIIIHSVRSSHTQRVHIIYYYNITHTHVHT
jgi:hypothetical protein